MHTSATLYHCRAKDTCAAGLRDHETQQARGVGSQLCLVVRPRGVGESPPHQDLLPEGTPVCLAIPDDIVLPDKSWCGETAFRRYP